VDDVPLPDPAPEPEDAVPDDDAVPDESAFFEDDSEPLPLSEDAAGLVAPDEPLRLSVR
jgi:hypothetical protein